MKNFDCEKLQLAILNFVLSEGSQYSFLEFWIDTGVSKKGHQYLSLYLNFHAFNTSEEFEDVIKQVIATEDFGLISDCIDHASKQVRFELADIDQKLATGDGFVSWNAEQEMIEVISSLTKKEHEVFRRFVKIFFYWIGSTQFTWIRR